jgi:ribosome-associated protein
LLDVRELCSFADFFVFCSAQSNRQIEAICQEVDQAVSDLGEPMHHREGTGDSGWVLLDFGDVIVHVFSPAERAYYQLEQLWNRAVPLVRVQ